MLVHSLCDKNLITPPQWMADNIHYLTYMGSVAYGVATESSDNDLYGFCIPPKEQIFPHLAGEIPGFGTPKNRFEQYQQNHIVDQQGKEYDIAIYSIVKYFQLCMQNNPNMIDSLFTPNDCVRHITKVGLLVRDHRRMFLHKGSWQKFRGYAYAQLNKMNGKTENSKRYEMIQLYGYDLKFAYHVIRLICEVEQILTTGDIDLRRDAELLKSIRRGEWTEERVRTWFSDKEKSLESLYTESTAVPYKPDEEAIKQLLLDCLEDHYGSLSFIPIHNRYQVAVSKIADIINGL